MIREPHRPERLLQRARDDVPPLRVDHRRAGPHRRRPAAAPRLADAGRTTSATCRSGDLLDIYTYMKILAEDYDHTGRPTRRPRARRATARPRPTASRARPASSTAARTRRSNNQCVGQGVHGRLGLRRVPEVHGQDVPGAGGLGRLPHHGSLSRGQHVNLVALRLADEEAADDELESRFDPDARQGHGPESAARRTDS